MTRPGSARQLTTLLRLRWLMIRSRPKQALVIVGSISLMGALVLLLVMASRTVGVLDLPVDISTQALLVYPAALLLFTVVAIIAPFLAGGAIELFPPSQLVAYPVSPTTRFAASLALMPFNVTWLLQVILLAFLVVIGGAGPGRTATLAIVTGAFIVTATIVGQALAWAGAAVRLTRTGRRVTNTMGAALIVLAAVNFNQDTLFAIADRSPLLPLLGSGLTPPGWRLVVTLGLLAGVAVAARSVGVMAVGWTLRLGTETAGLHEGTRHAIRQSPSTADAALRRTLFAAVWRSKPIRRGLMLLVGTPIVIAAIAELQWSEIVVLPGLVAAGAALLFGVNSLSLLGSGAAWLGSQPVSPDALLRSLGIVTGTTIAITTLATTLGVAAFATGTPSRADIVALGVGAVASTAWVAASAVHFSVRHPYQADLRGARDAPAPPGAMAGYSIRLAGFVGLIGIMLVATSQLERPAVAIGLGLVVLAAATVRAARASRRWRVYQTRSRGLLTVAFG